MPNPAPTQVAAPDIALIHDGTVKISDLAMPLAASFRVTAASLADYVAGKAPDAALTVFFTSPRKPETKKQLLQAIETGKGTRLFVLPTHNSDNIKWLYDHGIDDYLVLPIEAEKLDTRINPMILLLER